MPTLDRFAGYMRALGISRKDSVVCYDEKGIFSSPRVWWTLHCFGMENVWVLDGGLPLWQKMKLPVEPARKVEGKKWTEIKDAGGFPSPYEVCDLEKLNYIISLKYREMALNQIVDARPEGRFTGALEEPYPTARKGYVPSAINVPYTVFLNEDGISFRPVKQLYHRLVDHGIDTTKPVLAYSGTGIVAAVALLALAEVGCEKLSLYDGGWIEYVCECAYYMLSYRHRIRCRSSGLRKKYV